MRIGIFTDTYEPQINGVVTSIAILKRELIKAGHEVFVFCPRVPGFSDATPNIFRFPSIPFWLLPEHRISFAASFLVKNFEKLGLDIIHSHTPFFIGKLAIKLAKKYHLPHIHTYHTFFEKYGHYILLPEFINHYVTRFLSKRFCEQARLILVPSADMAEVLKKYHFKTKIMTIPTGIDLDGFSKQPDEKLLVASGLKKDRQYLIYAGRLAQEKNLDFLLNAFAGIAGKFPQVDFLLVGDGPKKAHLKRLAQKLNLVSRVIFTGYLDRAKVLHFLKIAKIFLFASLTEAQGLVILEAMAAGLPVVALFAMGIDEIMPASHGGFLTDHSEEEFSEKVSLLLSDENLWQKKSAEARSIAQDFSSVAMARKVIEIYRSFLK